MTEGLMLTSVSQSDRQAEIQALQDSQRLLKTLMSNLPGMVYRLRYEAGWTLEFVSEGCYNLTGYQPGELIAQSSRYSELIYQSDRLSLHTEIETALREQRPYQQEYRLITRTGEQKWVWDKGQGIFTSEGKLIAREGFITDISDRLNTLDERKRYEEELQKAEAKYRSIFENAIEGIFQTTPNGHYICANPALARLYGYDTPEELIAHLTDIEHQLYVEPYRRTEFSRLLQENDAVYEFESAVYRQDGSIIWISENARAVRDPRGTLLYYEGTVEDITERKRAKEQLRERAFYDALTGLPNRALFMERLGNALDRSKRHINYQFAVLFLDLDRFKVVNDRLGHLIGDRLLVGIARRLMSCLRDEDTVARLGGDEFTILLEDTAGIDQAIVVAERIHAALQSPFDLDGQVVSAAASIGIVLSNSPQLEELFPDQSWQNAYDNPEDLLRDADTALYRAKALGKGRHEVFDLSMQQNARALLQIETELRHALSANEFEVYYQPLIDLSTEQVIGFEALLRWQHPTKGLILPSEFLAVAEETGAIAPIGWWVFQEACCQVCRWQAARPQLTLNINLSSKQLTQPNLVQQIDRILQETGLEGRYLRLEIAESSLIENTNIILTLLELQKRQIGLCVEDFGVGYSSLSSLHTLPINILKIDRSFVSSLMIAEKDIEIARAIVTFAHSLGLEVIAEGIESMEQLQRLRSLDCELGQGYLFSKPLNTTAATALLNNSKFKIQKGSKPITYQRKAEGRRQKAEGNSDS